MYDMDDSDPKICVRIPKVVLKAMRDRETRTGFNTSEIVRQALVKFLDIDRKEKP